MRRLPVRRLERIQDAIDAAPVQRHLLREEYEWFVKLGELPDDPRLAREVVDLAMRGGAEPEYDWSPPPAERVRPGEAWPPSVRGLLFDEALYAPQPVRDLARAAIATEVAYGGDVASPGFAAHHGIPMYGSVALHVTGWPAKLAVPPYEEQARRLFVRLDGVRARVPHDDPRWFEAQAAVEVRFHAGGELPEDELHLDALLVAVELDLLAAHRRGKPVAKQLRQVGEAARAAGEERRELLRKVARPAK